MPDFLRLFLLHMQETFNEPASRDQQLCSYFRPSARPGARTATSTPGSAAAVSLAWPS